VVLITGKELEGPDSRQAGRLGDKALFRVNLLESQVPARREYRARSPD
jgi:hypothetical protein